MITRYRFRQAVGAFFLTEAAKVRPLLPPALTPLQAHAGYAVLAFTAFDFVESEVGPYRELVLSILVPPYAPRASELHQAASFPIALALNTPASREHAAQRWHFPVHERCLDIRFDTEAGHRRVEIRDGGAPVLELSVGHRPGAPTSRLYQCFTASSAQLHRIDVSIDGSLYEHEDERARLVLHDHPLAARAAALLADDVPFREHSMDEGEERFGALQAHGAAG